jgi:hypothetical protein
MLVAASTSLAQAVDGGSTSRAEGVRAQAAIRAALELRSSWDACARPRLVVDESSHSSNTQRLQGVWCEKTPGSGVFHSSPVEWEWLAATSSPLRPPATTKEVELGRRASLWLKKRRELDTDGSRRFFGNSHAEALVRNRLAFPGSRLANASYVLFDGDDVFVFERHPLGDLRPEDLPWNLVPWRPAWLWVPELSPDERAELATLTVYLVIRTSRADACVINVLRGARLMVEDAASQDETAQEVPCDDLARDVEHFVRPVFDSPLFPPVENGRGRKYQPSTTVREAVLEVLISPIDGPTFERVANPNVDAFPPARP